MKLCKSLPEAMAYAKNSSNKHQDSRYVVKATGSGYHFVQTHAETDLFDIILYHYKNGELIK
jgi:hypothetical protein